MSPTEIIAAMEEDIGKVLARGTEAGIANILRRSVADDGTVHLAIHLEPIKQSAIPPRPEKDADWTGEPPPGA